ncbi:BspA family leucine-rich repeat surface protein [Listeria grayi]|uniref:BspA family leucine-rich repeat surface protein n=1 Tax=Listeria grayi TaxID=1641 RepID=UPI00162A9C08|nr:BspA family leucine-rich repeat surface protein [Listeria grayi]MBC1923044.1 BspA family leucine-rich repeat surface protein [Listeria grayi]
MKNSIKKLTYATLTASILLPLMVSSVQATETINVGSNSKLEYSKFFINNTGKWGDVSWNLQDNGTLELEGGTVGNSVDSLSHILTSAGVSPEAITSIQIKDKLTASNIDRAFADFPNLQKIMGLNKLDYSGSAYCMFLADSKLESIDLTGFKTDKITNMGFMFGGVHTTSLDLSNFDTSNVTTMSGMFDGATALEELNLSTFNTKKVVDMSFMFAGATSIKNIDLSNFDTSNVMNMNGMLGGLTNISNLDVSNFDTSKVTNMEYMFSGDKNLESLNLSAFNTENVKKMKGMFNATNKLAHLSLSNFNISSDTDTESMFSGANNLSKLDLGKKTHLKFNMALPNISKTDSYTGYWQNVGAGTVTNPTGEHVWTSEQLLNNFDSETMGDDTYVWQKESGEMSLDEETDYSNDLPYSTYLSSAVTPLHPYRYNVVLNNNYTFYSKLIDGQSEKENTVDLGDKYGVTVYNQKTVPVTYTSGDKKGQTVNFVQISDDGRNWYWIDEHALNLDLASTYPSINKDGHKLIDGVFLSSTNTHGAIPHENTPVNSQMIGNAFNQQGKIIYQSQATESDFSSEKDPSASLKAFNDTLDRAANDWNGKLGTEVFIKKSSTQDAVSLKVRVNPNGSGSATSPGGTGIDEAYTEFAMDHNDPDYDVNILFILMRHELGHSLGLNHTSGVQYIGMPDEYRFSSDDDVMAGQLVKMGNHALSQTLITENDINAVKLILANHNFANPKP